MYLPQILSVIKNFGFEQVNQSGSVFYALKVVDKPVFHVLIKVKDLDHYYVKVDIGADEWNMCGMPNCNTDDRLTELLFMAGYSPKY